MLRHWRRDARILAFVTGFVVLERLGFGIAPGVIVIVMSIAPSRAAPSRWPRTVCGGGDVRARLLPSNHFGTTSPSGAAPLALAAGVAACWLIALSPASRPPATDANADRRVGWILAGMAILSLLSDLMRFTWKRSPLAIHGRAHEHLAQIPGLIALAALLASRRHRAGRPLAILSVAVAVLALVGGPAGTCSDSSSRMSPSGDRR